MYDVIMLVIEAGGYSLPDVLGKIEREWVLGNLTDEDRDSLIDAARANATPEGSMAPLQERMAAVELALKAAQGSIEAMDARLKTLEGQEPPEPPVADEWPEFVRDGRPRRVREGREGDVCGQTLRVAHRRQRVAARRVPAGMAVAGIAISDMRPRFGGAFSC